MSAPDPVVASAGGAAPPASCAESEDGRAATAEIELALCRSALYEALAVGFRPPSPEMVARLATADGAAGLVAAAELLDRHAPRSDAPALASLVRRLAETDTAVPVLDASYQRLFGHTVRGEAPAYETEYGSDDLFRQPHEMADVSGFYAAFGLALAPGLGERSDHVSCECEFSMFLARKEAVAFERDDMAMLAETRKAARLFLRDHLGRFVPSLGDRLRRAAEGGFYAACGALADAFVRHECARLEVNAGPATLHLRTSVEDRVPMACGTCPLGDADDAAGEA
jgi:TorA maturation chaperone TorD